MAEKKRIARIGSASAKGTAKIHSDDELAPAENNLILDIMQSMNKSKIMSYQQLQEYKSKESCNSRSNNEQHSSKQNSKDLTSKQTKKFVTEKTFPLMAKCQKSMKYLKKNRCIPKPRAHVGFVPRPPQRPISDLELRKSNKQNDLDNTIKCNESLKIKQKSKRNNHSPEINSKPKKPKILQKCRNSCDKNVYQTIVSQKDSKFASSETDSDNELEHFFQKHHPAKCKSSDSSNSSTTPRKKRKSNKTKKKRKNPYAYLAKRSKIKMTRKTLSESEEPIENEVELNEKSKNAINDNLTEDSCDLQFPSKRFHRIVEQKSSDDSMFDTYINNSGNNYSSSNCSEDESTVAANSNKSINFTKDLDNSETIDFFPCKSFVDKSTSLSELKDTMRCDALKSKCIKRCFVKIVRDPLLDDKAKKLYVTNSCDDDCVIIDDTNCNNSENVKHPILKDSFQESLGISNSPSVSEVSTDINKQNKSMHIENLMNSSDLGPLELEKQKNEVNDKETTSISNKMLSGTENDSEDKCISETKHSHKNVNDEESCLNNTSTSTTGNGTFNVQILSVKSLNECDIIVLSDDNEENETVMTVNESNKTADDSDVEIICLDSSITREDFVNEVVSDVSHKEIHKKSSVINEHSNNSSAQSKILNEEDCIILDIDNHTENISASKRIDEVQQSSQINIKEGEIVNNELKKSNTEESMKVSVNIPDSEKNSILKILGTIDFNSIKEVLNQTDAIGTSSSSDISTKDENSLTENIQTSNRADSLSEKLKQSPNNFCASIDEDVICTGSEINISSLKNSPINTGQKYTNLAKNSCDMDNIQNESNNVTSSNDKTPTFLSANASASTLSEEEIASHKIDVNSLHHSRTKQLLPFCNKKESSESVTDVLDIIAAQSIYSLDEKQKKTILPLVDLYKAEYKKFMEIRCTEENVTAGLKLLEESQVKKLMHISSSIKKIANNDTCFHKVKNEFASKKHLKNSLVTKEEPMGKIKIVESGTLSFNSNCPDDKVRIFNPSVVEGASEVLKSKSVGPSSSQEVYNHLINSVCAECGKHPISACSGCAKVFYCSEKCGMAYWNKGHCDTCRR